MSGHMPLREVLKERARRRGEVVEMVRAYAEKLGEKLGGVSVVLFGSYARGDFNLWSDIDVIIVSESFRGVKIVERCTSLGDPPERLSPICWTPEEAAKLLKKRRLDRGAEGFCGNTRRLWPLPFNIVFQFHSEAAERIAADGTLLLQLS